MNAPALRIKKRKGKAGTLADISVYPNRVGMSRPQEAVLSVRGFGG